MYITCTLDNSQKYSIANLFNTFTVMQLQKPQIYYSSRCTKQLMHLFMGILSIINGKKFTEIALGKRYVKCACMALFKNVQ